MIPRYLSSFIITSFIYGSLVASSFYMFSEDSLSKSSKNKSESVQRVSINLVEPKQETQKKPKKETKEIKKKIVKKLIKKDKPKEKIVKKIEPKRLEKKTERKVVKKEPIKQNLTPQKTTSKTILKDKNIEAKKIKEIQNQYFATISETINKNKSYPRRAVLRNLQDNIKVEFTISQKGELISCNILEGKKIFHNSAQKAIEKSFPLTPPKGILNSDTKLKLTLAYKLN